MTKGLFYYLKNVLQLCGEALATMLPVFQLNTIQQRALTSLFSPQCELRNNHASDPVKRLHRNIPVTS
jgi:hypothetical protein